MDKSLKVRIWIILALLAFGVYKLWPTIDYYFVMEPTEREKLSEEEDLSYKSRMLSLGLDLQGGIHLVLEVDVSKVRNDVLFHDIDRARSWSMDKKIDFDNEILDGQRVRLTFRNPEMAKRFRGEKDYILRDTVFKIEDSPSENSVILGIDEDKFTKVVEETNERALTIIRNRVDQFGVSEPVIRPMGTNRIVVELAGIKDPSRAKKLIQSEAVLEFYLVEDDESLVKQASEGRVPPGYRYEKMKPRREGEPERSVLIFDKPAMTARDLKDARVGYDSYGKPIVNFEFGGEGIDQFFEITSNNVGKQLAVVLDDQVITAPEIRTGIRGRGQIEGNFTEEEAFDLAIKLRAGALPAPMVTVEERSIGPSLGQDSIAKGMFSLEVGAGLVIIFMLLRYKKSGLIANVALMANVFLILAGLSSLGATLTLPGIAGIILTVGMAVDANVIIFERIREELQRKKTLKGAIESGYDMAYSAIIDANLTTILAAAILYQFGTGPIKGFAVTLSIGIVCSLITGLYMTKTIYLWLLDTGRMKKLSI